MGIKGFILVIGLISADGSATETYNDIGTYWYNSQAECEVAMDHPMVKISYNEAFPNHQVRMFCQPVVKKGNFYSLQSEWNEENVDIN